MPNEFHFDIPAAVLDKVQQSLDDVRAALAPYLTPLTMEDRKSMLRMADKTVSFVQKATEYGTDTPAFVPAFVDMRELKQDAAGLAALAPIRAKLEQLTLDTDSTMMVAGSEAYGAALTLYGSIQFMAKKKQPGAQAAYDELRQRFSEQGKRKAQNPPTK